MACKVTTFEGGMAIACTRGTRRKLCSVPNCTGTQIALCDYPVKRGGKDATCDKGMCATHRTHVAEQRDFCPPHAKAAAAAPGGTP